MTLQELASVPVETPRYFKAMIAYDCGLEIQVELIRGTFDFLSQALDDHFVKHAHRHKVSRSLPCSPRIEHSVMYDASVTRAAGVRNWTFVEAAQAEWRDGAYRYELTKVNPNVSGTS